MNNTAIDKKIRSLGKQKRINTIRENIKEHNYNALFFTYEPNWKKKVHFAYFACSGYYNSYAILCKEDKWLDDGHNDDGHKLDIVELLDGEAIFMTWDEAVRDLCPECKKYLSLKDVVLAYNKNLKLQGEKSNILAIKRQQKLHKQSIRLERVANKQ